MKRETPEEPDTRKRWQKIAELSAIHQDGMARLNRPGDVMQDPWSAFAALKVLSCFDHRPAYLEAMVCVCVTGRIRSAVAMRALRKLRVLAQKAGEEVNFAAFCGRIDAHLAPMSLTQHGFDRPSLGTVEHEGIWRDVALTSEKLAACGYDCFLNSGTLLGVTREGGLIGHDDDVDLAIVLKARSLPKAIAEWQSLTDHLIGIGLVDEAASIPEILRVRTGQGMLIDLFPTWRERGKVQVYPYSMGALAKSDVFPLATCALTGLSIPARPEAVLTVNYGEDWRIPNRFFHFPWAQSNRAFAEFLDGVRPAKGLSKAA